jgi:hypothetical protein
MSSCRLRERQHCVSFEKGSLFLLLLHEDNDLRMARCNCPGTPVHASLAPISGVVLLQDPLVVASAANPAQELQEQER